MNKFRFIRFTLYQIGITIAAVCLIFACWFAPGWVTAGRLAVTGVIVLAWTTLQVLRNLE